MKMTITEQDAMRLTGKFIIQVDSDTPDYTITEKNWPFVSEKRLSLVVGTTFQGLYYEHKSFKSYEELVLFFNDYVFSGKTGDTHKGQRFHRLLTSSEIDFVCQKMKERNY
jgi:hypothetical protein